MLIDRNSRPEDFMIEGRPEVQIVAFGRTGPYLVLPEGIYVYAKTAEGIFDWEGGLSQAKEWGYALKVGSVASARANYDGTGCRWGNIVPRAKLDVTKPIYATNGRVSWAYDYLGTFTPADGSEPIIYLKKPGFDRVEVYASTGRVVSGSTGSALRFSNNPGYEDIQVRGQTVTARITETDGIITNIEVLNK